MYVVWRRKLIRGWQQSRPTADRPSTRGALPLISTLNESSARRIGDSAEFLEPPKRGHGENLQWEKGR